MAKLAAYALSFNCCSFIENYLTDRFQRVRLGDQFSDWSPLLRGIPQGSVLGPLLFNIFIYDLLLSGLQSKISSYADDKQMFNVSDDISLLHGHLQTDLITAHSWFYYNGLMMNPDKCTTMWQGRGTSIDTLCFPIGSEVISVVEDVKLLGVTIDRDLKFSKHIADIVRKVGKQVQVLQRHKKLIDTDAKVKLYDA